MPPRLSALKPRPLGSLPAKVKPPALIERLSGRPGQRMREEVRKRDGYLCQACKREGVIRAGYQVDHIQDLNDHGTNALENQELLCKQHHDTKTAEALRRRTSAAPPLAR